MDQVERTARLIRSKGVGVYFVTQAPTDVPSSVLAQLGNRIQHALRAFTPEDADALRKTARTFPMTEHYDVEKTLTSLGIGEALVTVLSPGASHAARCDPPAAAGLAHGAAPAGGFQARIAASLLATKYATAIDRESAHEMISGRIAAARAAAVDVAAQDAVRDQVSPTSAGGLNTMTPAQQQREIARQARAMAAAEKAAERQRQAEARRQASLERVRQADARRRDKQVQTAIRTGGKVLTSKAGQDIIRGVFGTLFGRKG